MLPPTLFNGDLSSLRELRLESVRTELPWRNMVNLTSITLIHMWWGEDSIKDSAKQLLDFLESAPHLRTVNLLVIPTRDDQDGRLVSLARLERMEITGGGSASPLLNHLLIPVGANLRIEVVLPSPPDKDHLPRFLDNLRNFPDFTDIRLIIAGYDMQMQFSGPNGQVEIIPRSHRFVDTGSVLESVNQFDTSNVKRLRIDSSNSPSTDLSYRVLLPMKRLRTLALHCGGPHNSVHALHPAMSSSGVVACPELEELVIAPDRRAFDMESVIGVAAARASRGLKLKSVGIAAQNQPARTDVLELEKHVSNVECGPE